MEDITTFVLPELAKKPEKQKKPVKTVLDVKERLPKQNRTIPCAYCGEDKIIAPDTYQLLFDTHGSDEKILEEFMCKSCEMAMKRNPFLFWAEHGAILHELSNKLKTVFSQYNETKNLLALQTDGTNIMHGYGIFETNFDWIVENQAPVGMTIKNFPFIGNITLKVYEQRKNRIIIHR